jgi:hypothetical protein
MIDSLRSNSLNFKIWVLCLTEECKLILDNLDLPEIESLSLHSLENDHPELLIAKSNRTTPEYYFTLSPFWPNWVLRNNSEIDSITYLDADLEFFCSPQCLFDETKGSSIGIIEHRFHPSFDISKNYGRFNVGWIYFQKDHESSLCLANWQSQCLEWCKDYPEDGKFADQKYLDNWPKDYKGTHIIRNPGANLAPWNIKTHKINYSNGNLYSDDHPVVFYHFQLMKALDSTHFLTSFEIYKVPIEQRKKIIEWLYKPHIIKLLKKEAFLNSKGFKTNAFISCRKNLGKNLSDHTEQSLIQAISSGEVIRIT